MTQDRIRQPAAAGAFYSSDPGMLKREIKGFLGNAQDHGLEGIRALITPHAGYMYSGQIAAHAYRQIEGKDYDCVLVIAPSHSELFDFVSIYPGGYETPLGIAQIDKKNADTLVENSEFIKYSSQGHKNEHSLEVQVPFLQVALANTKIVPMAVGNQSPDLIDKLADTIGQTFKQKNILMVASSDLSHYHPYDAALSLDQQVEKLVAGYNIQELADRFFSQAIEMCGGAPVLSAMIAARELGAINSKVLVYKNSGDVTGDHSAVVGYLSAVIY